MVDLSTVEIGTLLKVVDHPKDIAFAIDRYSLTDSMICLGGQVVSVIDKREDDGLVAVRVAETGNRNLYWEGICFDYVAPPVALSEYIFQEDLR